MAEAHFEQEIIIQAPLEDVLAFMEKMENHQKIHPLVVSIRLIESASAPDGVPIRNYAIRDRMRLGPLTISFTYHTAFQVRPGGELILDATQFPRILLHNIFRFQPEGAGTRVKAEVNIQAPRLLIKTVFEQAQQSHRQMWLNLKTLLEAQGAAP
jgi:ligand-binding SRPBCC domain-containing protein